MTLIAGRLATMSPSTTGQPEPTRLSAYCRGGPRDDLQPGPAPGLTRAEHHQAVPRARPCQTDLRTGNALAGGRRPATPRPRARVFRNMPRTLTPRPAARLQPNRPRGPSPDRWNGQRGPVKSRDDPLAASPSAPAARSGWVGTSTPMGRAAGMYTCGSKPELRIGQPTTWRRTCEHSTSVEADRDKAERMVGRGLLVG